MNERALVQAKLRNLAVAERKHSLKHFKSMQIHTAVNSIYMEG